MGEFTILPQTNLMGGVILRKQWVGERVKCSAKDDVRRCPMLGIKEKKIVDE